MKKNTIAIAVLSAIASNAYALPTTGTFKQGSGLINNFGSTAEIRVDTFNGKGNAVVNVDNFNIGAGEGVSIYSTTSVNKNNTLLVNDKQGAITNIDGTLSTGIKTILVNPNGIRVGSNAVIHSNYGFMAVAGTLNESTLDVDSEADVVVTFNPTTASKVTVENGASISVDVEVQNLGYDIRSNNGTGYDVYEYVTTSAPTTDWNALPGVVLDTSASPTVWGAYTTHGDIHYDRDVIYRDMQLGAVFTVPTLNPMQEVVDSTSQYHYLKDANGRALTKEEAQLYADALGLPYGYTDKHSQYFTSWSASAQEYADYVSADTAYQQAVADYGNGLATQQDVDNASLALQAAQTAADAAYQVAAEAELANTASFTHVNDLLVNDSFTGIHDAINVMSVSATSDILFNRVNFKDGTFNINGETARFSNSNLSNTRINSNSDVVLSGDVLGTDSTLSTTKNVAYDHRALSNTPFVPATDYFDINIEAKSIGNINNASTINYDTTRSITGTMRDTNNSVAQDIEGNNLYGLNQFIYNGNSLTLSDVSNSRIFTQNGTVNIGNAFNTSVKNTNGDINISGNIGSSSTYGTHLFRARNVNFNGTNPQSIYDGIFMMEEGGSVNASSALSMNNTVFGSLSHFEHPYNTVYNTNDYQGWNGVFGDVSMTGSSLSEAGLLSFNNLTMMNSNINGTAPSQVNRSNASFWNNPGTVNGGICITFYCQRDYLGNVDTSIHNDEGVKTGFTMEVTGDLTMNATGSGSFSFIYGNDNSFNSVALLGDVTGAKYVNRALTNSDQPSMGFNSVKADNIYLNDATKATFEGTTSSVASWNGDAFLTVRGNTTLNNGVIGVNRFANGTTAPVVVPPTPPVVTPPVVTPPTPPVVVPPVVTPPTPPVVTPPVVTPPVVVTTPIVLPTFNVEVRDDVKETKVERNTLVLASPNVSHEENVEVTTKKEEE